MTTARGILTEAAGWYGKLATLGDFALRRLPAHWLEVCDPWLSASMRAGEEHLRERWIDAYRNAPILRFAWAPEVIDGLWWFGLLMPSCDSVGRYFPLLLTQSRARPPEDRIALDHLELWFNHLARSALQTLNDNSGSVDALEAMLQQAPAWPTPSNGIAVVGNPSSKVGTWTHPSGLSLTQGVQAVVSAQWTRALLGHTVWWRMDPFGRRDSIEIVRGLPEGARFVALIEGVSGG